jgi:hypothetical protein
MKFNYSSGKWEKEVVRSEPGVSQGGEVFPVPAALPTCGGG